MKRFVIHSANQCRFRTGRSWAYWLIQACRSHRTSSRRRRSLGGSWGRQCSSDWMGGRTFVCSLLDSSRPWSFHWCLSPWHMSECQTCDYYRGMGCVCTSRWCVCVDWSGMLSPRLTGSPWSLWPPWCLFLDLCLLQVWRSTCSLDSYQRRCRTIWMTVKVLLL